MREGSIARNYAEALFTLGDKDGNTERYAGVLEALAGAMQADDRIRVALESPRVPKAAKAALLTGALRGEGEHLLGFLRAVVKRGRQTILPVIAREYGALVDIKFNRVHAGITLARPPDAALGRAIVERLSAALEREVIPHFHEDPAILGGALVRVGDRVMDGSLRRRLARLRRILTA